MKTQNLYNRLDFLEGMLHRGFLAELERIADTHGSRTLRWEGMKSSYVFRRSFSMAVVQIETEENGRLLSAEREILMLREKLNDDVPGPVVGLIEQFVGVLQEEWERHHDHYNALLHVSRAFLKKLRECKDSDGGTSNRGAESLGPSSAT